MYSVWITQLTVKGVWVCRSVATEQTLEDAQARIDRQCKLNRERGYRTEYRVIYNNAEVLSGTT